MKNITDKALVVTLNIQQWTARKYDRKVTNEVNEQHNTQDAGRFNKLLIAKDHLNEINKIASQARGFHYDNTLPWGDNGERLLPSKNYFEYTSKVAQIKNAFDTCVTRFCDDYPLMIEEAKKRLNGLFNAQDYPDNIQEKFCVRVVLMPVPNSADFRVDLSEHEMDVIKMQVENEVNDRFAQATASIYSRIKEQLQHMHERLADSSNVFRDSLFENLHSLIDLIPRLNISGDGKIESICEDMKLLCVDPSAIREDEILRAQKAKEVDDILKSMNSFFKPIEI